MCGYIPITDQSDEATRDKKRKQQVGSVESPATWCTSSRAARGCAGINKGGGAAAAEGGGGAGGGGGRAEEAGGGAARAHGAHAGGEAALVCASMIATIAIMDSSACRGPPRASVGLQGLAT
eukprot:1184300-Prorocentrum_minimum.AAC.1